MMEEISRAREALQQLDANCSREEWVKIGMAAKSSGLSFDDFNSWSANASNYSSEKDCNNFWKSIEDRGGITSATLFGLAKDNGWEIPAKSSLTHGIRPAKLIAPKAIVETENSKANEVWAKCIHATNAEAYIFRKQGIPDGLRIYPSTAPRLEIRGQDMTGYLVVPCWSGDKLLTLQFIPPGNGDKLNLPQATFGDGFFKVGEITKKIYICEGIGQAWAAYKATGYTSIVCFGAGRLLKVTTKLKQLYPNANLVIVPDVGKELQASEIANQFTCSYVTLPDSKPGNYDINDYLQEHGAEALLTLLIDLKAPLLRYTMLSGEDLCNSPPMKWMVKGVLPAEGLSALYGASGSGKSFLSLDMGCAIASGEPEWFGTRIYQAPVTYVCLEGEAGLGKRIKAWSNYHNKSVPSSIRFVTQPFDLLSNDVTELARSLIAAGGANGLVMVDTLNRAAAGADENSSVDMSNLIAACKRLQGLAGGMVLLVHHTGKDTSKGLRGHSSLHAALDGAIEVVKTDARREWSVAKSKDDATGTSYPFYLEIVEVDIDEDGEPITSCVAIPNNDIETSLRRTIPPKSGNQKIIWDALNELLKHATSFGKANAPSSRPCLLLEDAINKTKDRLLCEVKRQRERTQSAITGLVSRGLLEHKEGWLWIA